MPTPVTLISGDGIGPSISSATVRLLEAAGADISWDAQYAGMAGVTRFGDPIPDETLDSIKRTRVALKGPLETPVGEGFRSINVALRKTFELYANVRPTHTIAKGGRYDNIDIVLIRENTEGLYIGNEHYIKIGSDPRAAAESIALITRAGSERICRYAFDYAEKHGRKKVTLVHKANILKNSSGLFLDVGRMVARQYANIEFQEMIVDAMAMNLVLHPERYGVGHRRQGDRQSGRAHARGVHDARLPHRRAACPAHPHGDRGHDPRREDGDARPRRHGDDRPVHRRDHRQAVTTTVFHCSDLHFGHPAVPEQYEAMEALIQDRRFDVVAISGDP